MLKLNELRTEKGLSQKELSKIIGVKNYTIGNWEQGRSQPSIDDLIALANFFECSIDYLLNRENDFGNILIEKQNLTDNELFLINSFKKLSSEQQDLTLKMIIEFLKN